MYFNFRRLTSISLTVALGLSLPISAQAEKNKKTEPRAITQSKIKWEQEPSSFLGVKLNEPLNVSASGECPIKKSFDEAYMNSKGVKSLPEDLRRKLNESGTTDDDAIKLLPEGVLCYRNISNTIFIKPVRVPSLLSMRVRTDDSSPTGKVEFITSRFKSSDFSQLKNILVAKYGPPHTQANSKVKTQGGAEFDNQILDWLGEEVFIHVESLTERNASKYGISEYGDVQVLTKNFVDKQNAEADRSAQESANKL
jgi:hypothetical protein